MVILNLVLHSDIVATSRPFTYRHRQGHLKARFRGVPSPHNDQLELQGPRGLPREPFSPLLVALARCLGHAAVLLH